MWGKGKNWTDVCNCFLHLVDPLNCIFFTINRYLILIFEKITPPPQKTTFYISIKLCQMSCSQLFLYIAKEWAVHMLSQQWLSHIYDTGTRRIFSCWTFPTTMVRHSSVLYLLDNDTESFKSQCRVTYLESTTVPCMQLAFLMYMLLCTILNL